MLRQWTASDVAYNYRGLEVAGTDVNLTFGARNVFDRRPQRVNDFAGMESLLNDPRGRLLYGRVTIDFKKSVVSKHKERGSFERRGLFF